MHVTTKTYPHNVTVVIKTSTFVLNIADTGGGLAIGMSSDLHQYSVTSNRLLIENCLFDSNTASAGSSMHISQMGNSQQPLLNTTLCCSNFTNNGVYVDRFEFEFLSSVFIQSLPMTLQGTIMFTAITYQL